MSTIATIAIVAAAGVAASGLGIIRESITSQLSDQAFDWIIQRLTKRSASSTESPDELLRRRVTELSNALTSSGQHLSNAAVMLVDLQKELAARMAALDELRRQVDANEELKKVSAEAAKALDELIEAKMHQQERRITRISWFQGALFAVFGASVAVLVVVFSHFLPAVK